VSTLRIRLFGTLDLERDEQSLARFPSRKARELFAYLVLNRHTSHPREHLAGLFWGDSDDERARHSLNTALWRLNGVLAHESGRAYLRVTPQEIGFNLSGEFWLDVAEFESRCALAEQASTPDQRATLYSQAVSFYSGELLPDCYEEWCTLERDRLQCLYLRALGRLVNYHAKRQHYDQAIDYARRILSADGLREEVHRALIDLYLSAGQPAAALRQYRACEDVLQRELAVKPAPETQALLAKILASQPVRQATPAAPSLLAELARELAATLELVQQAAAACNQVQARLQELTAA
jgi:DNA-binding SARP family transcriptional activator